MGARGTIGKEVVRALSAGNEIIEACRTHGVKVDIRDVASIRAMYKSVGKVDAVISAAGSGAWKPLAQLTDEDFTSSLSYKLMGQVNLIRYGFDSVADRGSITVTSGVLSKSPTEGSSAISLVNAGLEGFTRAAALEAPRGIRVNVVSPRQRGGKDPQSHIQEERVMANLSNWIGTHIERCFLTGMRRLP